MTDSIQTLFEEKYLSYAFDIKSNIGNLTLKTLTALNAIKNVSNSITINNTKKTIVIKIEFTDQQQHIFNKLLDKSEHDMDELTEYLVNANSFFEDYEVSRQSQNIIDKYIANTGRSDSIWTALTSKPDYNLCLYMNRTLPYFHLECKDWVEANMNSLQGNYVEGKGSTTTDSNDTDTKNNNYLEWGVLPVNKYPDMDLLTNRIKVFYNLKLQRQALMLFMKLMLSPKDCHIIKCIDMWEIFKPHMAANKHVENIVKYCFYFAMYILRQEETIMFSQVKANSRVLFTLEEACALPTFAGTHMERSPYVLQLTDDTRLSDSIPFHVVGERHINNKAVFDRRFELATAGIFNGIDLKQLSAAVTGSILLPCVHTSPLEKGFGDVNWTFTRETIDLKFPYMVDTPTDASDIAFLHYLEYYYPSYCSLTDDEFSTQVLGKKDELIPDDDIPYEDEDTVSAEKDDAPKLTRSIIQSTDESEQKSKPTVGYNQLSDIDVSITTRDMETFKSNTLSLFYQIKKNCAHRGEIFIKEIKTIASTKFKIYGPGLSRPMDVFRIPYNPVKMVKKFHVHCVKMYYDNNITMFRSCVAALLSGIGESYKWFTCNKVPIDVLLKYAQRGITIILNTNERTATSKFLHSDSRWGASLKKLDIMPESIYCCVNADHPFFHPGLYGSGIRKTLRKFQRDIDSKYASRLVVPVSTSMTPYGDLLIKDNNKQWPPNPTFIAACLDFIVE